MLVDTTRQVEGKCARIFTTVSLRLFDFFLTKLGFKVGLSLAGVELFFDGMQS